MPIYTYICNDCGIEKEHFVFPQNKNKPHKCECGGIQKRRGLESFSVGSPAYQMAGVLADGTHIPGHFGKDAKRIRKNKQNEKSKKA